MNKPLPTPIEFLAKLQSRLDAEVEREARVLIWRILRDTFLTSAVLIGTPFFLWWLYGK